MIDQRFIGYQPAGTIAVRVIRNQHDIAYFMLGQQTESILDQRMYRNCAMDKWYVIIFHCKMQRFVARKDAVE